MITDGEREEFAATQRRQFEEAGPFSEDQRAAVTALFLSIVLRRARETGRAIAAGARERASENAPAIAAARENDRETPKRRVSGHVKGGAS